MNNDLISRQVAINALGEEPLVWHEDDAGELAERNQWRRDVAVIKALPSAQPERATDVNDILAYLDGVVHPLVSPENWSVYSELHDMVSALPSTQKQGEWEEKEVYSVRSTGISEVQSAKCSVCGKYHAMPYLYFFNSYSYCPHCGARMGSAK